MRKRLVLSAAMLGLAACGGQDDPALALMPPGGILLSYTPATNDEGFCQPERRDVVDVGVNSVYAIRGETRFVLGDGTTRIPFQSLHKYPDEKTGMSEDKSISILNQQGACEDLIITVTIESCEYLGEEGLEERACPAIGTSGASSFQDIEVIRDDRG
ncbi:MAG: hypothetical protein AAF830_02150 [Pseudomonadota bacterium]